MMKNRSNQRWQKGVLAVQPRPTCAEKVRRFFSFNFKLLSNRPTSSNLPRTPAHMHPRVYARSRTGVCVFVPRQVRRLDSGLIRQQKNRPTTERRLDGLREVGR